MKNLLMNLLMKHLIDIVINEDFSKIINFSKFNKYYLVSKHTKSYFSGKFRLKSINKY